MRYVDWNGKRGSVLGFGCGSVMGRVGRGESLRAMAAAWEGGVTLFDTARSYGYGEAEALLGEFLRGKREEAVVVTKFGIWPARQARWKRLAKPAVRAALNVLPGARGVVRRAVAKESTPGQFSVAVLRASLEESLRALRTDYVDALLVHEAPESVMAQEDLMAELELVVREGKARRVGLSPNNVAVMAAALEEQQDVLTVLQFPSNLFAPGIKAAMPEGLRVMVNHPFGGEARIKVAEQVIEAMRSDVAVASTLREKLGGDTKIRLAEIVFAEVMEFTGADVVVPSMLHLENLRANLAAIGSTRFTADERAEVRRRVVAATASR